MAVSKTCLLLCLGALLFVAARSETAGENGSVHEIESFSDWRAKLGESQSTGKLLVAEFWATWCGPCRAISPIFTRLSEKYDDVIFVRVDVDSQPDISAEVGVRAMPTFMAFRDGSKVGEVIGANPPALVNLVEKYRRVSFTSIA